MGSKRCIKNVTHLNILVDKIPLVNKTQWYLSMFTVYNTPLVADFIDEFKELLEAFIGCNTNRLADKFLHFFHEKIENTIVPTKGEFIKDE